MKPWVIHAPFIAWDAFHGDTVVTRAGDGACHSAVQLTTGILVHGELLFQSRNGQAGPAQDGDREG